MNFKILFLGILWLQNSTVCRAQTLKQFTLEGRIEGKDSGYVYINYRPTGDKGIIDSCMLQKGTFFIRGYISEPTLASFTTFNLFSANSSEDKRNSAEFYIEPSQMKLVATINHFQTLKLTGSEADSERTILVKLKMPIDRSMNPILDVYQDYSSKYSKEMKIESDTPRANELLRKIDSLNKRLQPLYKEEALIDSFFIVQHPQSYVAAEMLWSVIQLKTIAFPSLEKLYSRFPKQIRDCRAGKLVRFEIQKEKNVYIGAYANNFIAIDNKGDTIRLSDYRGKKYVLLDFGASWCAPCRRMIPYLKKDYAKFDTAMEIISIAAQSEVDDWQRAIREDKVEWPQIIENKMRMPIEPTDRTISEMYYIDLMPSLILIDKNSRIIGKYGGFYSSELNAYPELKIRLNKLFAK